MKLIVEKALSRALRIFPICSLPNANLGNAEQLYFKVEILELPEV